MVYSSCISDRSLVAHGAGLRGLGLSAPWWRSLVGSALSSGAKRWRLRASGHSFTGSVVVVGFHSLIAAEVFAFAWSGWCGLSLAVRRYRGVWGVSVPVASGGAPAARVGGACLPSVASWVRG